MLDLTAAFATFPLLETERLVLRAVVDTDADAMFEIMRDTRVLRYFGKLPMQSRHEAEQRVAGIQAAFREQQGVRWAITQRTGGQFLGSGGFWRIDTNHHRAEVGYELAAECWGRGVATEAVGIMLDFGFKHLGLHSVEASIHPGNVGSRRVLLKLGFAQEGYFHENYYDPVETRFTDTAVFSLLKTTWLSRT